MSKKTKCKVKGLKIKNRKLTYHVRIDNDLPQQRQAELYARVKNSIKEAVGANVNVIVTDATVSIDVLPTLG